MTAGGSCGKFRYSTMRSTELADDVSINMEAARTLKRILKVKLQTGPEAACPIDTGGEVHSIIDANSSPSGSHTGGQCEQCCNQYSEGSQHVELFQG